MMLSLPFVSTAWYGNLRPITILNYHPVDGSMVQYAQISDVMCRHLGKRTLTGLGLSKQCFAPLLFGVLSVSMA